MGANGEKKIKALLLFSVICGAFSLAAFGIDLVWLVLAKGKLSSLAHPLQFFLLLFLCGIFLLAACFGLLRYFSAKKRTEYIEKHTLLCPACGKRIASDSAFCPACGRALDKNTPNTSEE